MPVKILAIGSRLMGDDSVAIHVAEKLISSFESNGIEVIIGETDVDYCLSKTVKEDYIIVLDATLFGIKPGTVTVNTLGDIWSLNISEASKYNGSSFSQHGYSLINALQTFHGPVDGIFIGIEGQRFDYSLALSCEIEDSFELICNKVMDAACHGIKQKMLQHAPS